MQHEMDKLVELLSTKEGRLFLRHILALIGIPCAGGYLILRFWDYI